MENKYFEELKKNFGFGDQNEATMGLKITGFIMSIIGTLLVMLSI